MTLDLNRLRSMTKEELIDLAKQLNAPFHHSNKAETLIENITNKVFEQIAPKPDGEKLEVAPKKKIEVFLTEQEAEAALMGVKEKYKAFSIAYDHEAKCATMRYNDGRYKHSETISLSCSRAKFIRKANEIARGPLVLVGHKLDEWGRLGGNTPNNAYAEAVLAG